MALLDKPEDYEALGLQPPEHVAHGTDDNLGYARLLGSHTCQWQQRGNHIWCVKGEHEHGRHHDPSHILVGTGPDGEPIFKVIDNSSLDR